MRIFEDVQKDKIEKIEWAALKGIRPRAAGYNARSGYHGKEVPVDIVQITINGLTGFGWSRISKEDAKKIVGLTVSEIFIDEGRVKPEFYSIEFPLLDWLGRYLDLPVYQVLLGPKTRKYTVSCYDTSLYFDDLHLDNDEEAVELMQSEALEGLKRGHRDFKIKVGRGAMHMPLERGKKRDIAIINGIREIVGPDSNLMIDANNGYNLNLTKEILAATVDSNLTWVEEAFHEDPEYLKELRIWLERNKLDIMIVDGEGLAATGIVEWAKNGLLDAIQFDIRDYGFHNWLKLGIELDKANVKTAPHNYGGSYGNYALIHLAPNIKGFLTVEWDEMRIQGIDDSAYRINEGKVLVPDLPGFGLEIDGDYYSKMVDSIGWSIRFNSNETV